MDNQFKTSLKDGRKLRIQQVIEGLEVITGIETRNRYDLLNDDLTPLGHASEDNRGWSVISRYFFGHWRRFSIRIYDCNRVLMATAHFPFRWIFKELHVIDHNSQSVGSCVQRFSLLKRKFEILDSRGRREATLVGPLFRPWTFEFYYRKKKKGTIQKKWSGLFSEAFTDRDNYVVSFADPDLTYDSKLLYLCACLMIDIVYFERHN